MKSRDKRSIAASRARTSHAGQDARAPRRDATPARPLSPFSPRHASTRAIAALVPKITRKAFEKHGFAAANLIIDWPQIVGGGLARDTRPLKLKWPRSVDKFADTEEGGEGRPGATLTLQVDPAIALDVQYQTAQIIERINAYFGYRAVVSLRIVQEAIEAAEIGDTAPAAPPSNPSSAHHPGVNRTKGAKTQRAASEPVDALEQALARLGAHIEAESQRRRSR